MSGQAQQSEADRQQAYNRQRLQDRQALPDTAGQSARPESAQPETSAPKGFGGRLRSLRQIAKQQQAASKGEDKQAQSFAAGAAGVAAQKLTANFLRESWLALIPSFGLTLLYINFHLFQRLVGGLFPADWFADFGTEWTGSQRVPMFTTFVGIGEILLLILLDALIIILLLTVVLLLIIVIEAVRHPLDTAQQVLGSGILGFGDLYNLLWQAFGSHR